MRLLCSLLLIAAPMANAVAGCAKDTTKASPSTLSARLHVAALHFDLSGTSGSMNGQDMSLLESRLAVAFCRWPSYTLAAVGGSNTSSQTTTYVVPGSSNFHPNLSTTWSGIELQKRWRDSSIVRPMVSVAWGQFTSAYLYSHRLPSGEWEEHEDGKSSAYYLAPAAGVEVSLFRHVTSYLLFGVRNVGTLETPGVEKQALNGAYASFGFGFGKFR